MQPRRGSGVVGMLDTPLPGALGDHGPALVQALTDASSGGFDPPVGLELRIRGRQVVVHFLLVKEIRLDRGVGQGLPV